MSQPPPYGVPPQQGYPQQGYPQQGYPAQQPPPGFPAQPQGFYLPPPPPSKSRTVGLLVGVITAVALIAFVLVVWLITG